MMDHIRAGCHALTRRLRKGMFEKRCGIGSRGHPPAHRVRVQAPPRLAGWTGDWATWEFRTSSACKATLANAAAWRSIASGQSCLNHGTPKPRRACILARGMVLQPARGLRPFQSREARVGDVAEGLGLVCVSSVGQGGRI